MTRAKPFMLAAVIGMLAVSAAPVRAEFIYAGTGAFRYLSGSMSKSGVTVDFDGYIETGAYAESFGGQPEGAPYTDSAYGYVHVVKGTSHKFAEGPFTVTIDPGLATAKISGSISGVTVNITVTPNANPPAPEYAHSDPTDISPNFAYAYGGAAITRAGISTGSMSSSIGSISGGSGPGSLGSGIGGGFVAGSGEPGPGGTFWYVDYGPHRLLNGSILKDGIRATFRGSIATGVSAYSFFGEPGAEPYVDSMWGYVEVKKGAAIRQTWAPFQVTVDPGLATAKISGSFGGVSINVTLTGTGTPGAPIVYTPDPGESDPPNFIDVYTGAEVRRPATAAGSASATGVGGFSGGTGGGEIGFGEGGFVEYWSF